jgi:3-deoxy-D-manno-octulosonate 8-phosphate phosphatase (KDO 8-P phosphatase)
VREPLSRSLAERVRLVVLDVDGVMTDGGVYIGETADGTAVELKRFDTMDQLGAKMLVWAGLPVVLVSGRPSDATKLRAAELGVPYHAGPGGHKLPILERLLEEHGVGWDAVACVCDDLADLPILRRAGLPVAVANAAPEVRAAARWCTARRGGHGAVREFAEALLGARGAWAPLVREYCRAREPSGSSGVSGRGVADPVGPGAEARRG